MKWLVRIALWCVVLALFAVEIGACHDIGGGAEKPPVDLDHVQLNG